MKRKRKLLSCVHRAEIRHFLRCSRAATVKKCTKKRAARAKLLFCLLNLLRFFPFLLTSPLSLLKLFTVTVGYILHHIVLGLNVFSVRSCTQMGGVFFYILFLKLPCSRLLYLLNEKKKTKPNKTNQPTKNNRIRRHVPYCLWIVHGFRILRNIFSLRR